MQKTTFAIAGIAVSVFISICIIQVLPIGSDAKTAITTSILILCIAVAGACRVIIPTFMAQGRVSILGGTRKRTDRSS